MICPSVLKVIFNVIFDTFLQPLIVIEMLHHIQELREFMTLIKLLIYFFESIQDFTINSNNIGKDHDSKEHQWDSKQSFLVTYRIIVSKAYSCQGSEHEIENCYQNIFPLLVL